MRLRCRCGSGLCVCGCVGSRVRVGREMDLIVVQVGERVVGGREEAAVGNDLARSDPSRSSSAAVGGSSVFSAGLPGGVGRRQDEPAGAGRVFSVTSQICAT